MRSGSSPIVTTACEPGEERAVGREDRRARRPRALQRQVLAGARARDRDRPAVHWIRHTGLLRLLHAHEVQRAVPVERPEAGEVDARVVRRGRAAAVVRRARGPSACSARGSRAPTSPSDVAVVARSGGRCVEERRHRPRRRRCSTRAGTCRPRPRSAGGPEPVLRRARGRAAAGDEHDDDERDRACGTPEPAPALGRERETHRPYCAHTGAARERVRRRRLPVAGEAARAYDGTRST